MSRHPDIQPELYCGLPVRVEHRDPRAFFADWQFLKSQGFDMLDFGPRRDPNRLGIMHNGFTVQWCPRLRHPIADQCVIA